MNCGFLGYKNEKLFSSSCKRQCRSYCALQETANASEKQTTVHRVHARSTSHRVNPTLCQTRNDVTSSGTFVAIASLRSALNSCKTTDLPRSNNTPVWFSENGLSKYSPVVALVSRLCFFPLARVTGGFAFLKKFAAELNAPANRLCWVVGRLFKGTTFSHQFFTRHPGDTKHLISHKPAFGYANT